MTFHYSSSLPNEVLQDLTLHTGPYGHNRYELDGLSKDDANEAKRALRATRFTGSIQIQQNDAGSYTLLVNNRVDELRTIAHEKYGVELDQPDTGYRSLGNYSDTITRGNAREVAMAVRKVAYEAHSHQDPSLKEDLLRISKRLFNVSRGYGDTVLESEVHNLAERASADSSPKLDNALNEIRAAVGYKGQAMGIA